MNGISLYKIFQQPELTDSTLIICWDEDAGKMGLNVFNFLSDGLSLVLLGEIEPRDYFSLGGVLVESDIALFPESSFYYCAGKNLVVLKSNLPRFEWFKFVNTVLDLSEKVCKIRELYTVGGMVSVSSHNLPRVLMATMNSSESKAKLSEYNIVLNMDYETPPGQRPTMSSYLIWAAMQRKIIGISLWVPVPFYMVNVDDFKACRQILDFFNQRLMLGLDMRVLEGATINQSKKIDEISNHHTELKDILYKLENNTILSQSESNRIVEIFEEQLK